MPKCPQETTTGNLYIPYVVGDTGVRDPVGPLGDAACNNFWSSPGLTLDPARGAVDLSTYQVESPPRDCGVLVQVHNRSPVARYENVSVEVWLCNPSTGISIAQALFVSDPTGATPPPPKRLRADGGPLLPSGSITIRVNGFKPYAGLLAQNNGHLCLAGNCFGMSSTGEPDGSSLLQQETPAFNFCCNPHHAQRNLMVKAVGGGGGGGNLRMHFDLAAVNPDYHREEEVLLEVRHVTGPDGFTKADWMALQSGPYHCLPLHHSPHEVRQVSLHTKGQEGVCFLKLNLGPSQEVPVSIVAEFDHHERPGSFHTFEVTQRTTRGIVQGGVRVLAVFT